jgi:hypothetical protein
MVNQFRKTVESLNETDFQGVERELGVRLPREVRDHYLQYNGGIPEHPCWKLDWGDEYSRVSTFLPMKYTLRRGRNVESVYRNGIDGEYLVRGLVPFANDEGGNYYCFNEHGEVFFYAGINRSPTRRTREKRSSR